jgi:hypothetical protein
MASTVEHVRVTLAGDNFYPQAFRWAGRSIRVLFVEGMRTVGVERLFRVRTIEGTYELAQHTVTQVWRLRRQPSWWARALNGGDTARYQPASGRGRISRAAARALAQAHPRAHTQIQQREQVTDGGGHASGLALVR